MAQLPESQVMARLRHEVLTVLYQQFPRSLTQPQLVEAVLGDSMLQCSLHDHRCRFADE